MIYLIGHFQTYDNRDHDGVRTSVIGIDNSRTVSSNPYCGVTLRIICRNLRQIKYNNFLPMDERIRDELRNNLREFGLSHREGIRELVRASI